MEITLRAMSEEDWNDVARIYTEGIKTGNATFQQDVPDREEWDRDHIKSCRIIAESDGETAGWAALTKVSGRCVYAGVAEVSVYVTEKFRNQKIGTRLLKKLIEESETFNIWTLQAGIFPENKESISLHEKLGFRIVGVREKLGNMNGVWRDVILLERRSKSAGID